MHIVADHHSVHPDPLRPIRYARKEAKSKGIPDRHGVVSFRRHNNAKERGGAVSGVSHVNNYVVGTDRLRRVQICGVPSPEPFKAVEPTNLGVFKTILTSAPRQRYPRGGTVVTGLRRTGRASLRVRNPALNY